MLKIRATKGSNFCLLKKEEGEAPIQGSCFVCVYPIPVLVGPDGAVYQKFRIYSLNN